MGNGRKFLQCNRCCMICGQMSRGCLNNCTEFQPISKHGRSAPKKLPTNHETSYNWGAYFSPNCQGRKKCPTNPPRPLFTIIVWLEMGLIVGQHLKKTRPLVCEYSKTKKKQKKKTKKMGCSQHDGEHIMTRAQW